MFVDWSGSMGGVLQSVIEQVIILVSFCRKANIKFQVLAFSDRHSSRRTYDTNGNVITNPLNVKNVKKDIAYLKFDHYRLLEMFNSNMSTHEFNTAIINMISLGVSMSSNKYHYETPDKYYLGGTPLNNCISNAKDCIAHFKKVNGIEIINSIFLTDGDSYGGYTIEKNGTSVNDYDRYSNNSKEVFLKTRNQEHLSLDTNRNMTESLLKWVGQELDINVLGFFITNYDYGNNLKRDGYKIEENTGGYSRLYTIYTRNFSSQKTTLKSTKDYNELVANLRKNQISMRNKRNFVKNFIELIA